MRILTWYNVANSWNIPNATRSFCQRRLRRTNSRTVITLKIVLSRIQLPQFSGTFENWTVVLRSFPLGKHSAISDIECFHYLQSCLQELAQRLIRPLSVTGKNYNRAWALLQNILRIKKKSWYALISPCLRKWRKKPPRNLSAVKGEQGPSIRTGRISSTTCWAIPSTSRMGVFDFRFNWSAESWCTTRVQHQTDTNFEGSKILCKPLEIRRSTKMHIRKHEIDSSRCVLCTDNHTFMQCNKFKAKSASERLTFVKYSRLCYNCLGNHPVAKCQSTRTCWTCQARHHSMLHDAYMSSQNTEISTLSAVHRTDNRKTILLAKARTSPTAKGIRTLFVFSSTRALRCQ